VAFTDPLGLQPRTDDLSGVMTPTDDPGGKVVDINKYNWDKHCRGLFELPIAA